MSNRSINISYPTTCAGGGGISYEEMVTYIGSAVPSGCIDYEELVDYVATHAGPPGPGGGGGADGDIIDGGVFIVEDVDSDRIDGGFF
jgi:hypothetical protein